MEILADGQLFKTNEIIKVTGAGTFVTEINFPAGFLAGKKVELLVQKPSQKFQ